MTAKTTRSLTIVLILMLIAGLLSIAPHHVLAQETCPANDKANADKQNEIILIVNAARQQQGLKPLLINDKLFAASLRQSRDMSQGDFLDHTGSDGSVVSGRVGDAGYDWSSVRENILYRWDTEAQAVFDQWWNSPGHKANMLANDVDEIGVAYECQQVDGANKYYFTMDLGASLSGPTGSLPVATGNGGEPAGNTGGGNQTTGNTGGGNEPAGNTGGNTQPVDNTGGGEAPIANTVASTCGNLQGAADQESAIVQLINQARGDAQLSPLKINGFLTAAAQRHSNDMSTNDFLDHVGSDNSDVSQRLTDTGYPWTAIRQSILLSYDLDAAKAYGQWWNSEGNKANMLADDVTDIGIAVGCTKIDNLAKYYYTMVLATSDAQPSEGGAATELPS